MHVLFDKNNIAKYLTQNYPDGTVLDNDKTVGRDCLTYMLSGNKFVQSIETKNVVSFVGMHLEDWINNPEEQLKESIAGSLDYGFTRFEATFYSCKIYDEDYYYKEIQNFINMVKKSNLLFKCPIKNQWKAFAEFLTCNFFILNMDTKEYTLGMWCNTLTRRIGGVHGILTEAQFNNVEHVIHWVANYLSYRNGIINIATLKTNKETNESVLKLKSENEITYVPGGKQGCLWYSSNQSKSADAFSHPFRKTARDNFPKNCER